MASKILMVLATILVFSSAVQCNNERTVIINREADKLAISLYVTIEGKDQTNTFLTKQFDPLYKVIKDHVEIEFIPWGPRSYENEMLCDHNTDANCRGDRMHCCALEMMKAAEDKQIRYMMCEYEKNLASSGNFGCIVAEGEDIVRASQCFETKVGDALFAAAAKKSKNIKDKLSIMYDGVFNITSSADAIKDFKKITCALLEKKVPKACELKP